MFSLVRKIQDSLKNEDGLIFFPEECETLAVNAVRLEKGSSSDAAAHDDEEEVYVVVGGAGTVELDGVPHKAAKGDVLYIPRNTMHLVRGESEEPFEYVCVAVWPDKTPERRGANQP